MNRTYTDQGIKNVYQLLEHIIARSFVGELILIALEWARHLAGIKGGILQTILPATSAKFPASIRDKALKILKQHTEKYGERETTI